MLGDSTATTLAADMIQHLLPKHQQNPVIQEAFLRRLPLDIRRAIEDDETLDVCKLAKSADTRLKGCVLPNISAPPPIASATSTNQQGWKTQGISKKTGPKT